MKVWIASSIAALALAPTPGLAHSGGTDANGCHTNRKTGEYHCHRPKGGGAPAARPTSAPSFTSGGAHYPNCAAARAAGAAPLYRGRPDYRAALDRDGDGVACE